MGTNYTTYINHLSKEDVDNLFLYVEDALLEDLMPLRELFEIYGRYLTYENKLKLQRMYADKLQVNDLSK